MKAIQRHLNRHSNITEHKIYRCFIKHTNVSNPCTFVQIIARRFLNDSDASPFTLWVSGFLYQQCFINILDKNNTGLWLTATYSSHST